MKGMVLGVGNATSLDTQVHDYSLQIITYGVKVTDDQKTA